MTDDIDRIILGLIIERSGKATKNDVVFYMNEKALLSRVPTLNKLKELELSGKIIVLGGKNNRRGQAHFLTINNQNAYNRVYNWLVEIEIILDKIETPLAVVYQYIVGYPEPDPGNPDPSIPDEWYDKRSELFREFALACYAPIDRLLDFLFILSNRVIQSDKDSQLLNQRIVNLKLRMMNVFSMKNTLDDIDFYLKEDISSLDNCLKNAELRQYTKEPEKSIDFSFDLLKTIKKFRNELIQDFDTI